MQYMTFKIWSLFNQSFCGYYHSIGPLWVFILQYICGLVIFLEGRFFYLPFDFKSSQYFLETSRVFSLYLFLLYLASLLIKYLMRMDMCYKR